MCTSLVLIQCMRPGRAKARPGAGTGCFFYYFSIISRPGPERKKGSFQDLELDNRPGLYYNASCASYIFVLFLIQTGRI